MLGPGQWTLILHPASQPADGAWPLTLVEKPKVRYTAGKRVQAAMGIQKCL